MRSLRIAVFIDVWPPEHGGGVTAAHRYLARLLRSTEAEVKVFTFLSRGDNAVAATDFPVERSGPPPWLERPALWFCRNGYRLLDHGRVAYQTGAIISSSLGARRLNSALRSFAPDILILPDHGAPGLFLDIPHHCRTILVSHHNASRFLNEPLFGSYSERDTKFSLALEQRVLSKVDRVVCPTQYMRQIFSDSFRYEGPIDILPNLIDFSELDSLVCDDPRERLGLDKDAPLIYIPSAGSKYKGARYVFEIVRRIGASSSTPVGFLLSGKLDRQTAHELKSVPANVRILNPGRMPNHDLLRMVAACSFCVSPTLIENCSMAFLEAMSLGVPVVTFDVGGNAEIVTEGVTGHLVPRLDIEGLIDRCTRLLDPTTGDELRRQTAPTIRSWLSPDRWLPQWLSTL